MLGGKTIYLDYQASTPLDPRVADRMHPFYSESFGNPHSSEHIFGWQASKAVEFARGQISYLINADLDEIIFTSGATEANNLCLTGVTKKARGSRSTILVSSIEHKCILNVSQALESHCDVTVKLIPVDSQGLIDLECLEQELDEDVLIVSVMAVNNEIGTIQPIKKIGELAHKVGALFHCDAAQAPCAMDIDVDDLGVDLLSLSAHKFYGPKGVGAAYIRRDLQKNVEPIIYGGGQENGLRGGTLPVPLCVGMGMAATLIQEDERLQLTSLRDHFISSLISSSGHFKLNGPSNIYRHPGNANICFRGVSAQDLLTALQPKLAASSGAACTSGIVEPSYVLRAIGLSAEDAESSIRFSLGRMTTKDDVDNAVALVLDAIESLTQFSQ